MRRYASAGDAPPSATASSASRTKGASRSGSENTATVAMPISRAVRWMRRAISPRWAISNFRMPHSHPEDAELARAPDLVRVHDAEPYPEQVPALTRVDDSLV